jgi:hypothetical protein
MEKVDFYHCPTDEELRAYAELTPLERLHRLDNLRRFTLMVRQGASTTLRAAEPAPQGPVAGDPAD